jgi:hypothetical protein
MAGKQIYTSSLFVQSGSVAKFESGLEVTESIRVDGTISASGYFDLEGNQIIGGVVKEFFAGTSTGVSASIPYSEDIFVKLPSGKVLTEDVIIHTTHSNTFDPNHYAFVKIEDEFRTKQEGSSSYYDVGSLEAGVHRYLVYGAQTGSGGETHQVYTTLFVKGFLNEAPELNLPTGSSVTMSIGHDESTGSLILHFTNSFDENNEDAISFFTASKLTSDPSTAGHNNASYTLVMSHSNFSGESVHELTTLQTSSLDLTNHTGLNPYTDTLFFTASVSNYSITNGNAYMATVNHQNRNDEVEFEITLKDENEITTEGLGVSGVTTKNLNLHILAPPTASIENIRTEFEDGGFTGIPTSNLTHTLLYDRTESLSSASIVELHDRYTSSLIRLSTKADITPPAGYNPHSNYNTFIRVMSNDNDEIVSTDNLSVFKFKGGESTASFYGDDFDTVTNNTESLGFTSFTFKPTAFINNTQSLYIGSVSPSIHQSIINSTYIIRHGNNNHYQAFPTTPNLLKIQNIPNIEISDIVVEVESGSYGSNVGHPNLTSSLLYGYSSSLKSEQTQSLIIDKLTDGINHPQYLNYISSSVVRLRVKAQITEPFGPDHKPITFKLTGSNQNESEQFLHNFIFTTNSLDTASSNINYSNEDKPRLVGVYTSSWVEFNFSEGVYNFTTQLVSSSNASSTISTIPTAIVSMSNYNSVLLNDLAYETEEYGYAGGDHPSTNTTRQVLYGHNHIIYGDSSSYENHPKASIYASQSLRMRVKGKLIEPFGPATSEHTFNFISLLPTEGSTTSVISNAFNINTINSSEYDNNNQLITTFTSSFIGKDIPLNDSSTGSSVSSDWHLKGTEISNIKDGFKGLFNIQTQHQNEISYVTITDTPLTEFQFTPIETETFGESNIGLNNPIEANHSQVSRSIRFNNEILRTLTFISDNVNGMDFWAQRTDFNNFQTWGNLAPPDDFSRDFLIVQGSHVKTAIDYIDVNSLNIDDIIELSYYGGNDTSVLKTKEYSVRGIHYTTDPIEGNANAFYFYIKLNPSETNSGTDNLVHITPTDRLNGAYTGRRKVLGDTLNKVNLSELNNRDRFTDVTGSGIENELTASSVSRFRTLVTITEPLGPLHYGSTIQTFFEQESEEEFLLGPPQTFATNSSDVFSFESNYDDENRLTISYTSSFIGSGLTATDSPNYWETFINPNRVKHNPFGENGHNYTAIDPSSNLYFVVTGSNINIKVEDIFVEVESASFGNLTGFGSNEGYHELTSSLMYGLTSSLLSTQTSSFIEDKIGGSHPLLSNYNSSSIIRFRLKSKIIEPFGSDPVIVTSSFQSPSADFDLVDTEDKLTTTQEFIFPTTPADSSNNFITSHIYSGSLDLSSDPNFTGNRTLKLVSMSLRGDFDGGGTVHANENIQNLNIGNQRIIDKAEAFLNYLDYNEYHQILPSVPGGDQTPTFGNIQFPSPQNTESIEMVGGVVDISASFGEFVSKNIPIKLKCTFEYTVQKAENPILSQLASPSFSFGLNQPQPIGQNIVGEVESGSSLVTFEDGLSRTVNTFTSSWVEIIIPTGSFEFMSSYKSNINSGFGISASYTSLSTASVTMSAAPTASLVDLAYETEKHGYAGSGSNDVNIVTSTTRSVLYGDDSTTNNGTGSTDSGVSWASHPSASTYASHSVTRFRTRGRIIEPFGPATSTITVDFEGNANSSYAVSQEGDNYTTVDTSTLTGNYDSNNQLVTIFTSSLGNENVKLQVSNVSNTPSLEADYIISGSISRIINNSYEESPLIIDTPTLTKIKVKDTPATQISFTPIEIESFGGSNVGINNPNSTNYSQVSRSIRFDKTTTDTSSLGINNLIASYSVTRFRTLVTITEPLGPLHHISTIQTKFTSGSNTILGPIQAFATNSSDVSFNTISDPAKRLVISYTSSFTGSALTATPSPDFWETSIDPSYITHIPPGENGHNYSSIDTNSKLYFVVTGSENVIKTEDIFVEVESASFGNLSGYGSDKGYHELTSSLLFGLTSSLFSTQTQSFIENQVTSLTPDSLVQKYNSASIIRFKIKAKTTEPFGSGPTVISSSFKSDPLENLLLSPTFSFGLEKNQPTDINVIDQVESSSNMVITELPRVVNTFTSSWIELQVPTGSFELEPQFSIGHDGRYVISTTSNIYTTASVTMSKTPPTQLVDLAYETEKHGYAGSGSNDANIVTDTTRTVLYGDAHVTNATSESKVWENHDSASVYASHSVSRFRTRGKITEPFGPASCITNIQLLASSSDHTNTNTYSTLAFNTKNPSLVTWITKSSYTDTQRITEFTQSEFTNDVFLELDDTEYNPTENFIISGNVSYQLVDFESPFPKTNELTIETPTTTSIDVIDTPPTQITINKIETETFGDSGVGISNPIEANHNQVSRSVYNGVATLDSSTGINDLFTASAVTRFRALLDVVEPLGHLHYNTQVKLIWYPEGSNPNSYINGDLQTFNTNSAGAIYGYDSQDRLAASYTSSFLGQSLSSSLPGYWRASILNNPSYIIHHPPGEISRTATNTDSDLYFVVSKSFSDVDKITVSNLKVEVESGSYETNDWVNTRTTNVLHDLTGSETNEVTNATYPNQISRDQLVRARVMATIEEPFPYSLHNSLDITLGGFVGTKSFTFATNSSDTSNKSHSNPSTNQGMVGYYTSSYFPILLNASGNIKNPSTENAEKTTYEISASILGNPSIQTHIVPALEPLTDLSHSFIHVTGALSSSTAITVETASGASGNVFSSSFFDSNDTEKSLYFVYPLGSNNGYSSTTETIYLSQSLITTTPLYTSESNINFNDGHLDIEYTASNRYIDFDGSQTYYHLYRHSNPYNGIAEITITRPSFRYWNNTPYDANTVRKGTITTRVVDLLEGNGTDSISTDIFVIPAPPSEMSGDLIINEIGAHPEGNSGHMKDKFYFGLLSSESFDNYSGSIGPVNPNSFISSSRILFASTSAGYNYSMSLFTHTNNVADYSNGNSSWNHSNNLAYDFGDRGSLELKINDTTEAQIDLQSNFDVSSKNTTQTISGYDNGGTSSFTKGRLILTKVAPFNNVSQSIFAHGYDFPNGFQSWNASIELDDKIRDGYNHLELIHNILPNYTQSLNTFDWYYNEGIESASIKAGERLTYTEEPDTPATHSLSGVSYFKNQTYFTASIGNIYNLANEVYNHDINITPFEVPVFRTEKDNYLLVMEVDNNALTPINHYLFPNSSKRNGLRLDGGDNLIPTPTSTASITYRFRAIMNSEYDANLIQGEIYRIIGSQVLRFKSQGPHSYGSFNELFNTPAGRFLWKGGLDTLNNVDYFTPNTFTASFFDEDRRWSSASFEESQSNNPNTMGGNNHDYSFWLDSTKANYDSTQNITSTNDLQQLYTNNLIFPSESYNETYLPNEVDYSGIDRNQQRYYYTALKATQNPTDNLQNCTLIVSGNISKKDFPLANAGMDYDKGNINIQVRIPGPDSGKNNNSGTFPGTQFGATTGGIPFLPVIQSQVVGHSQNSQFNNALTDESKGRIAFNFTFGQANASNSQGILLVKVTMSGSIHTTGSIKQITIRRQ